MGVLHADLLAHLQTQGAEVHWILELDVSSSTTVRLSLDGVGSKSLGNTLPWLKSIGTLTRKLTGWRGSLEAPTCSAEIDDVGGRFTLAYGRRLRGKAARLKLLGPASLAAATHFTWFTGVVDSVSKAGSAISLGLRFKDDRASAPVPKASILPYVFTDLPSDTDLRGKAIPYLVGHHDSTGLDALGMVPCHYVGSPGAGQFRYVVGDGWWLSVIRVFSAGVEKVDPTDYSVVQAVTGDARKVTLLEFVADQGTNEVVADVQDLESVAGPCATFLQLAADLSYGEERGEHLSTSLAPINAASVTAADVFLVGGLGLTRSYAVPLERRPLTDILRELCNSYDLVAYWRYDGTLALIPWEIRGQNDGAYLGLGAPDNDLAALQVLSSDSYLSEPSFSEDPESTITRLLGKSGRRASDGSWLNSRSVVLKRDADMERSREIEMPWLPATAESVGNLAYMTASSSSAVSGFTAEGAASIEACVSQGPPPAAPDQAIRAKSDTATVIGVGTATFDIAVTDVPEIVAGQQLTLWVTARGVAASSGDEDQIQAAVVIGGTPYWGASPIIGMNYQRRVAVGIWTTDPSTGLSWTRAALNAASFRVVWDPNTGGGVGSGSKRVHILQAYGEFSYTAAANVSPAALAIQSRLANRYREAPQIMTVRAPLRFLNYELGDDVPGDDVREGWGRMPWSRGRGRVVGMRVGPGVGGGVELQLEDVRGQLTTFWLQARALAGVDGTSAVGDGLALITPGSTVTVARTSPKLLDAPAGIDVQTVGPLVKVLDNCWPADRWGTLIEGARTNGLLRSTFATLTGASGSVPTGWTATGGTVASDDTVGEQLFTDASVSANVLLLTQKAGDDSRATATATGTYLANAKIVVQIARKGSSATAGDGGAWRLSRAVDGWFYNATTPGWQAGAVDNTLTPTTSWARFESASFSVGASNTTVTLQLVLLQTATTACTLRVGAAQIEEGEWGSSFIQTEAAAGARDSDDISIGNDKTDGTTLAHVFPNDRGWVRFHVRPRWASAAVTSGTVFTVFNLPYDASNGWSLAYVTGTGWRARARSGGANVDAVVNVAVLAGVEYELQMRWTSSLGEWDQPLTLTLRVVRVSTVAELGETSITHVKPVFAAAASFQLGHAAGADHLNGYILEARESPLPPSDAEMAATAFELAEAGS